MALGDTTELLADIRSRGSIPAADLRFPNDVLLAAATRELREGVAPLVHSAKAEHMVYTYDVSVAVGTTSVRIPPRALGGGGLRDVTWQQTGSNIQVSLREIPATEAPSWSDTSGTPTAYYVRNYSVVLLPTPNATGTLHMPYYARPNTLTPLTEALEITSVSSASAVDITFNYSAPTDLFQESNIVDVVRGTPGFETVLAQAVVETVDNINLEFTITTPNANVADFAPGDWICFAGTAPVVQTPLELNGLLAVRTVRRCLKSVGDARWQDFDADVQELEARALQWLSPRNDGESKAVSPINSGLLRGVMRTYIG